ncbi:MAG: glycoside hydrolase family 6 protein [Catenulispora sp.]
MVDYRRPTRVAALALAVGASSFLIPLTGGTAAQAATHVANPYTGSAAYLNPDYVSEVQAQASADNNPAEASVAGYQTAIWMDHIGAITGDAGHLGLAAHLDKAAAQAASSGQPVRVEVVVYDLPGRDCAALASNGEIPATSAGLTQYESQYVDPIATIEGDAKYANLRIVNFIEPDSLPNAVTNQSKSACAAAIPFYEQGIAYTLGKLHALGPQIYNYLDIGHSGWLGWPNNMTGAGPEYSKVVRNATGGYATVDGFVSDTANTTPADEPFLTDTNLSVGGQPLKSANFYQYNPYFDEHTYDEAMYNEFTSSGFPATIGMVIDTSRNGWGGPARPTHLNSSPTDVNSYVTANKVDQRPFRGDWCNVNGAGIGARPQANPYGAGDHIIADVWIKPPGESDGDYPTASHSHGDPHCDPAGTQSDGNGGTYPTDAFPGYDIPAGQWFPAQFQQLVANAYPAIGGNNNDTTPPSVPTGLKTTATTSSTIALSWTASTDNVGVTGYAIYRGTTQIGTSTTTTFTDTGLTASTQYTYTVKAFDAAGNSSAASTAVTATTSGETGDTTPPSMPTGLTASNITTSSITLSWTASTDNVGVTGYDVYRGTALAGSSATTSFTDTGLSASTQYTYTVKAHDAAGNASAASAPVTATTAAISGGTSTCDPNGTLTAGDYTIQNNEWNSTAQQCITYNSGTSWSVSTANFNLTTAGAPATYPSIFKGCHWGICTPNSGLPIQVSNLGSATSSWSTVQPASGAYDVAYDIWFNSTPTTIGQPDGTEIMIWINSRGGVQPFGSQTGTANLSGMNWNVWTGNQTSWKIISYVLNPGATSVTNLDVKALINDAVSRGSLNPAHYLLDAEAGFEIWQGGQGLATTNFSFNATAGTNNGDTTPPSVPTNVASTGVTSNSVSLSWSPSTDNVGVAGYRVYRGGTQIGISAGTSFTDTGLSPSTQYSYTVAAYDAAGNVSAPSSAVSATTSGGGNPGGCTATYQIASDWGSAFNANVTVSNTGTTATKGWTVTWTWGGNQQVTNMWNATNHQSGQSQSATNMNYNGAIAPGGNTSFGFQANYSGSNAKPTLTCTAS